MNVSDWLYESVKDIWEECCKHPFVQGIGKGNLDLDKFRYYMKQDYLYLLNYAKVFALGVVKADDEKTMREFSNMINDILNNEMSIHNGYMKKLNITKEELELEKPTLENSSYTHYMISVSSIGGIADIAVAILSCAWSYQIIAEYLSKIPGAMEHNFYGDWIKGYTSKEYRSCTKWNIDLVDKLAKDMTKEQLEKLKEIFINCSKYELNFWSMAYGREM